MAYCKTISLSDGGFAIVRLAGKRPARCRWCAKDSTKLCDFRLSPPGQITHVRTCDAPMCDAHAKSVGNNRDYCPGHAGEKAGA